MSRRELGSKSLAFGLRWPLGSLALGLFAASTLLTSCGGGVTGGGGSSGNVGAGAGLTVAIRTPASTVYTHGIVAIQVTVSDGTPDSVELLKDGSPLITLAPPYQYNWNTASTPEGSYQLVARATQGNQSFTSEPRTVIVDRTPPAVTSRIPSPNATNVFVDDPIVVGFTKPLLPASVVPDSFALISGSIPVPTTPLLSGDGKTVMLVRHISLAVPTTLTLTVTRAVTDLAGNALAAADAWTWSVPEWVGVGREVTVAGRRTGLRALALERTDKPVVAVEQYHLAFGYFYGNVYVQRWTGSAWQPVGGAINGVAAPEPLQSTLALDGSGTPFLAFRQSDGYHDNVYVRQWTGSAWQLVGGAINAVSGQDVERPVLALDATGKPVVAFREFDGSRYNVYVRRWTGGSWQPVGGAVNAISNQDTSVPALALDRSGKPVVAFLEYDGTHHWNVYVQQWTGSAWQLVGGAVNPVSGQNAEDPVLSLDGSDKPVVAFREYNGHGNGYVLRWTGSAWQLVGGGAVNAAPEDLEDEPSLALDGSGKPVVAFRGYSGTNSYVRVRRWTGSAWQSVGGTVNAVLGHNVQDKPSLALDGGGKPVVAFDESESDGSHPNVYVLRSNQ